MQTGIQKPWNWLLFPFSSIKAGAEGVYAASVGYGVYEIDSAIESWDKLNKGLEDTTSIHRLQLQNELLHACTNHGLYEWTGDYWENDGLGLPCYQYRDIGGTKYAGTDNGLWIKTGAKWGYLACEGKSVYDFMNLPQYLIIGHNSGISLYDRFMDEWAEFELERSITSLAVYRGHLLGTSDQGELFVGDKKGRFDRIKFGGKFIFSVTAKGRDIYVCTDQGLFTLTCMADRLVLLSVKLGFPVTDVDVQGKQLYMATLFQGVQSMQL
jgi:hypothetical protein